MGQVIPVLQAMRGQRVYLDTNIFIYFLECNTQFFPAVEPVMKALNAGDFWGCTGEVTIAETMVGPYRLNNELLISTTRDFFNSTNVFTILPHSRAIFDRAAQLRAWDRMKFIDAIHVATAMEASCDFFITNDKAIRSNPKLSVVQLDVLQPNA